MGEEELLMLGRDSGSRLCRDSISKFQSEQAQIIRR